MRQWTAALTAEGAGRRKLALASFLESTVVPVPLEVLVAPLMFAHPRHALRVAAAIWAGCILGALVFYGLALLLYEPVVQPLLAWLGFEAELEEMRRRLGEDGAFAVIFLLSVTPVPFQIATLGAGAAQTHLIPFLAAVALSRGIRYFGLALLAVWLGPRVERLLRGRLAHVVGAALVVLIGWLGWSLLT
ncbi:YqaA family protein [Pontivivens ytuae]|uniref:YqaA family protein n=1 Tax=Pontivivens ytuae TaxID=2789856 RepID=UPI001E288C21|nr:hypothetical protein [Pontivivens ytuae]